MKMVRKKCYLPRDLHFVAESELDKVQCQVSADSDSGRGQGNIQIRFRKTLHHLFSSLSKIRLEI